MMTKDTTKQVAKEKLESLKDELRKHKTDIEGLGELFDDEENRLLGPDDDIQYQKMEKDIEESGNE